jgi:alpha-methylacyl-CoA racemase
MILDDDRPQQEAPLAGLRFIDLTRLLPGPALTMHLADLGAEVIKVEDTGDGDAMRSFPPLTEFLPGVAYNSAFENLNRGKRSVAIDLAQPLGREMLFRLASRADALIEGFRPGAMERLGLSPAALMARHPKLVVCSLSGYGQNGPLSQVAGHDLNYCAVTGVLDQTRVDGKPAMSNLQVGDVLGGTLTALSGVLAAIIAAQRTGRGRHVDVAMTDSLLVHHVLPHASLDAGRSPLSGDTLLTGGVPCYRIYETADSKHLAVGALELKFWQNFCDAAELPELRDHHWTLGFAPASAASRAACVRTATRMREKTRDAWASIFAKVDACVSPVLTPAEALAHPHHRARALVHRRGRATAVGPLLHADGVQVAARRAPRAGQHSREVIAELGISSEHIDELFARGVLSEPAGPLQGST